MSEFDQDLAGFALKDELIEHGDGKARSRTANALSAGGRSKAPISKSISAKRKMYETS